MPCSYCGNEKVYAKGFCNPCYLRNLKNGTPEYVRNFIKTDDHCSVDDCFNSVIAKGLCDKHYRTVRRHGYVYSDFGYGERQKHPLYNVWHQQVKNPYGRVAEWNDFWKFVSDVGEKPSPNHRAKRNDVNKPWGPSNFNWKEVYVGSKDRNAYARDWRRRNKISAKSHSLKKCFGIDINDYINMYDMQQGRCFICGTYGTVFAEGRKGAMLSLVVDHCHKTGKIRKLLCHNCNKGIGYLKEDIDLMGKAIRYIQEHLA